MKETIQNQMSWPGGHAKKSLNRILVGRSARVLLVAWSVLGPNSTLAASRTVSFAGMAAVNHKSPGFSAQVVAGHCTVMIVNTGTSPQKVTRVEMSRVGDPAEILDHRVPVKSTGMQTISGGHLEARVTSGAAPSITGRCIDQPLSPGEFCLVGAPTAPVPFLGQSHFVCAGRIRVEDVDAQRPGSVTAVGTMSTLQEFLLLGGVLSGATYERAPTVPSPSTFLIAGTPPNTGPLNSSATQFNWTSSSYFQPSGNMNMGCVGACLARSSVQEAGAFVNPSLECARRCRQDKAYEIRPDHWETRTRPADPPPVKVVSGSGGAVSSQQTSWPEWPDPRGAVESVAGMDASGGAAAGGVVHEMILGPYSSICSGNLQYRLEGGVDFPHYDSAPGATQGERLWCAHRHHQDDLFARIGSSSTFPVNGGTAF